jgi:ADP-ribose pyrophosphatase
MNADIDYTHPDVLAAAARGEPWADPETDPTRIDWPTRQAAAAIPFRVVDGRPLNPHAPTGIRHGRNQLGHWGEQLCADAVVTAWDLGLAHRRLLMVERGDGRGWALPGGCVDPDRDGGNAVWAAFRELREETGLSVPLRASRFRAMPPRHVPDPRASDEAWMVTVAVDIELGCRDPLPPVEGRDDARRAAWALADTYPALVDHLAAAYDGRVFPAHHALLKDALGR